MYQRRKILEKTEIHPDFARLTKRYLIRAGDPRHTNFTFNAHNFMKLFVVKGKLTEKKKK
jgi:hypothetical protein